MSAVEIAREYSTGFKLRNRSSFLGDVLRKLDAREVNVGIQADSV